MNTGAGSMERYLPPAFTIFIFLVAYAFFFAFSPGILDDLDAPWHLATGYKILELGRIPASDPWSFTAGGHPLYVMSWGWDVMLAKLDSWGGFPLLFVATRAAMAGLLALLARHFLSRGPISSDAVLLALIPILLASVEWINLRSQVVGFLMIAWFHYALSRSKKDRPRLLYSLPPLMLLWVNLHGNFIIGFILLGAYGIEALLEKNHARFKKLGMIAALCALCIPLNPYGFGLYHAFVGVLSGDMRRMISEWQPFNITLSGGATAGLFLFILTAGFADKRIPLADKLVAIFGLYIMMAAMRNMLIFMVLSAPMLAMSLQNIITLLARFRQNRPDMQEKFILPGKALQLTFAALLMLVASFFLAGPLKGNKLSETKDAARSPLAAITYFKAHCEGHRFLTDYDYGGRLIYELGGKCPIFIDGREAHAYPKEVMQAYLDFVDFKLGWEKMVETYRLDGIFVTNDKIFARAYAAGQYREHWRQVYGDNVAGIYVRQ